MSGAKMAAAVLHNGAKILAGIGYFHPTQSKMLDNNCINKAIWLGLGIRRHALHYVTGLQSCKQRSLFVISNSNLKGHMNSKLGNINI